MGVSVTVGIDVGVPVGVVVAVSIGVFVAVGAVSVGVFDGVALAVDVGVAVGVSVGGGGFATAAASQLNGADPALGVPPLVRTTRAKHDPPGIVAAVIGKPPLFSPTAICPKPVLSA